MSLASERLAGLDPAISEALQHSAGYLDLARVALRAAGCKHLSSTSPLSSIRSGCASASISGSQHKAQQPIYSPVITLANVNYAITRTYPSLLIVPSVSLLNSLMDSLAQLLEFNVDLLCRCIWVYAHSTIIMVCNKFQFILCVDARKQINIS